MKQIEEIRVLMAQIITAAQSAPFEVKALVGEVNQRINEVESIIVPAAPVVTVDMEPVPVAPAAPVASEVSEPA